MSQEQKGFMDLIENGDILGLFGVSCMALSPFIAMSWYKQYRKAKKVQTHAEDI